MALINFTIGDIIGKVGGLVFQRGAAGAVLRSKGASTDKKSPLQTQARARLTAFSRLWTYTLTASQRLDWNVLAATVTATNPFGNSTSITGQNLFVRCNSNLSICGLDTRQDAPFNLDVQQVESAFILAAIAGAVDVNVQASPDLIGDNKYFARVASNVSPAITNVNDRFLFSGCFGAGGSSEFNPTVRPQGLVIKEEQIQWVEVSYINSANGVVSTPIIVNKAATPAP